MPAAIPICSRPIEGSASGGAPRSRVSCATVRRGGEFADVDADAVAGRLAALMDGLAIHMVNEDPGRTPEHYVEMALTAASAELGCDLESLLAAAAAVPEP